MRIFDELFDSIGCHASAPDDGLFRIDKETDREHLHTVLLNRFNQRTSVLFDRIGSAVLGMKHLRHGRPMDIRIQQTYLISLLRQSYR